MYLRVRSNSDRKMENVIVESALPVTAIGKAARARLFARRDTVLLRKSKSRSRRNWRTKDFRRPRSAGDARLIRGTLVRGAPWRGPGAGCRCGKHTGGCPGARAPDPRESPL